MAGSRADRNFYLDESSKAGGCSNNQNQELTCSDICKADKENMEQLIMARNMGVLESCPEDEVEGELIYFQHRLLQNTVARKKFASMSFVFQFLSEFFG